MDPEVEKQFKEAFDELSGGDGKITNSDLKKALEKGGVKATDDEVQQIIDLADSEGTGYISYDEFVAVICGAAFLKMRIAAGLRCIFMTLDADGSGYITKDNLQKVCEESGTYDKVAKEKIDDIMKRCDTAGDGKISFEEFVEGVLSAVEENM